MSQSPLLPGLSIILPVFNARARIASEMQLAVRVAGRLSDNYEVIVVDDGSTDGTASVVGQVTRIDPRFRLIVHTGHQGYGDALRSGMRAAGQPWVLVTDGELRIDPRAAEDLLGPAERSDLVAAWRVLRMDPLAERTRAATWNRLVTRLFALPVHDPDCGLKLVRRDLLEHMDLTAHDAMVGTELVVRAVASGARVSEVPFREPARDENEVAPSPGALRSLAELASLYRPLRGLHGGPGEGATAQPRSLEGRDAAAA